MAFVGYARVSTIDQDLSIQVDALKKAGCKKIFSEKKSGTSKKNRSAFEELLEYLREGDTLLVTRIDRLTRSILDLQNLLIQFRENKIHLKAIEQPVDTSSASGKMFLDILGVFAEFETNLRRERQLEGIARAKENNVYKGKKPYAMAKAEEVLKLIDEGFTRESAAIECKISVPSVYRILKAHRDHYPDEYIKGSRSNKKIAVLHVYLRVENNSKFVRGKNESLHQIEEQVLSQYSMMKTVDERWNYTIKVPYEHEKELDELVGEIISESGYIADLRNGFVEMDIVDPKTERSW